MSPRSWSAAIEQANAEARQPVLFLRDRAMRPNGWDDWITTFERAGYVVLALPLLTGAEPQRPDADALADSVRVVSEVVLELSSRPAIVGHGFGALVVQVLATEGLPAASVAVAPTAPPAPMPPPKGPLLVIVMDGGAASAQPAYRGSAWEVVAVADDSDGLSLGPRWADLAETALTFIQRFV